MMINLLLWNIQLRSDLRGLSAPFLFLLLSAAYIQHITFIKLFKKTQNDKWCAQLIYTTFKIKCM